MTDGTDRFFAFARERQAIYLRRQAGLPSPFTKDPILRQYRFTNVFRENDKTTVWFREHVREKLPPEQMLLATVVFRWFNRITTGEAIFERDDLMGGWTAWQRLVERGEGLDQMKEAILHWCHGGPYVTGAYIIKTPDGYNKLDGVLQCIQWFMEGDWREYNLTENSQPQPLEDTWEWLRKFPYLGDFMAYEIVTDLRWCKLWDRAPDIMTWANPGPGATRGLGRIFDPEGAELPEEEQEKQKRGKYRYNQHRDKQALVEMMRSLLVSSQDAGYWPQWTGSTYDSHNYIQFERDETVWPAWEMREVEHTLCEFDKYERVRTGEGRPRGRFP